MWKTFDSEAELAGSAVAKRMMSPYAADNPHAPGVSKKFAQPVMKLLQDRKLLREGTHTSHQSRGLKAAFSVSGSP